jgi:hypothetical protein
MGRVVLGFSIKCFMSIQSKPTSPLSVEVILTASRVMKDVTKGNNPGCGTSGFAAVEGWDPLTGLGTPIYAKMLGLFMSLP